MKHAAPLLLLILAASPVPAQTVVEGAGVVSTAEVEAFVLADADSDGLLNRAEFETFVRAMADSGQSSARTVRRFGAYAIAFGRVDADGDGLASPGELRRADDGYRGG